MAKKSMILKQQAPAKFSTRKYNRCKICGPASTTAARSAAAPTPICATTASAVSASANWLIRVKFLEFAKPASNFPPYFVGRGSQYKRYSVALPPRLAKN